MCPSCKGFGREPEFFWYIVIPGKWQLHEHNSLAQYVSCFPDIHGYGKPTVWMICLCVVNPALFRQVSCTEMALVSLAYNSGISWHARSLVRVYKCPTWTPEAASGVLGAQTENNSRGPENMGTGGTEIKPQITNRQLLVTKGMQRRSKQSPLWGMVGRDVPSCGLIN